MLMQVTDFFRFKRQNSFDGFIWMVTFLTVVVINIDIGLLIGISLNLIMIFVRNIRPSVCLLGNIPNTELYVDINQYEKAKEIQGVKIFQYR